jgi:alpha-L-fucosidase
MISNNHHQAIIPGEDFQAFEKDLPGHNTTGFGKADVSALPLETCETMNDSWGFNITDRKYKSSKNLVQYMVKAAAYNANFLLNVGPMPNGIIQPEFADTLKVIGKWLEKNGATIYGTRGGFASPKSWGGFTQKGKTVYMHILSKPDTDGYIFVDGLTQKISKAVTFNGKQEVKFKQVAEGTFIYTSGIAFDEMDTIIELTLQ